MLAAKKLGSNEQRVGCVSLAPTWLARRCHEMNYDADPEQGTTNDNGDDTAKYDDDGGVAPAPLTVNLELWLVHRSETRRPLDLGLSPLPGRPSIMARPPQLPHCGP